MRIRDYKLHWRESMDKLCQSYQNKLRQINFKQGSVVGNPKTSNQFSTSHPTRRSSYDIVGLYKCWHVTIPLKDFCFGDAVCLQITTLVSMYCIKGINLRCVATISSYSYIKLYFLYNATNETFSNMCSKISK